MNPWIPKMKTENLMKACGSFESFFKELREAHRDAVNSDHEFAEIAFLSLIEQAAELKTRLARVKEAGIHMN
jgi:hypothetical protein